MKLAIQASVSRICGKNDTLKKIHSIFSFRDKAAANELERLKKNLRWKERSLISLHGELPEDYLEWKKNKFEELRQAVHVHCCQFIDEETLEVPTGLIPSVIRELSDMGVSYDVEDLRDSERPRRLLTGQKPDQLRRPQAEALDLLLSDRGVAERGIGLIRLATGVGKTALAQELIRKFGHKSIFLVPSLPILKQTVRRFEAAFGAKNVKAYGGGKKTVGYITVATYQSVYKGDPKDFEEIDLVVADECLPYRQKILTEEGPMEIGKVYSRWESGNPPRVYAFDESKRSFELKRVTHGWKRPNKPLLKIKSGKLVFRCTENHKVLTSNGWKEARDLRPGDLLVGSWDRDRQERHVLPRLNDDQKQVLIGSFLGDGNIHKIKSGRYRLRVVHGEAQSEYCKWKASLYNSSTEVIEENGYSGNPAIRFTTRAFDLSEDIPSGKKQSVPEWMIDQMDLRAVAIWFMDDSSVSRQKNAIRVSTYSFDIPSQLKLVTKLRSLGIYAELKFQNFNDRRGVLPFLYLPKRGVDAAISMLSPYMHENLSYKIPPSFNGRYAWDSSQPEEGTARVELIEREMYPYQKRKSNGVFDLEVEDLHNFVACSATGYSGVVVHNCHHVSADTFYDVLQNKLKNAVHRYGLTAYEERADGSTMLIESAVGPVVYKYDAPEAIRDGYLAKPTFIVYDVFKTQGSWTKYKITDGKREAVGTQKSIPYNGDDSLIAYRNWVLGNDLLNAHVAGLATALSADNKSILILVDEKEHGDRLMSLIPGAGFCIGGGKDNERLLKEFNSRKLKVLIGTSTLGEGADTVPVDVLINMQGGASKSQTLQANGRALRNETDEDGVARKPTCVIVDFNFPLCDMLSRHAGIREQIHRTMGEVHHEKMS